MIIMAVVLFVCSIFLGTVAWLAVDDGLRVSLGGLLVWVKESWCRQDRFSESVADSGDTPAIGISFEFYEIIAM